MAEVFMVLGGILLYGAIAIILVALAFLYLKNFLKVVQTVQGKTAFSFRTVIRGFGIFFPLLGIAMGFVKGA